MPSINANYNTHSEACFSDLGSCFRRRSTKSLTLSSKFWTSGWQRWLLQQPACTSALVTCDSPGFRKVGENDHLVPVLGSNLLFSWGLLVLSTAMFSTSNRLRLLLWQGGIFTLTITEKSSTAQKSKICLEWDIFETRSKEGMGAITDKLGGK